MTNRPSLSDIIQDPDKLRDQPLEVLDLLTGEATVQAANASQAKKLITAELERRYSAAIEVKYRHEEKDTGTVHLFDGAYGIEANRPKKVEWAQPELAAAVEKIRAAGDNPAEYVTVSYGIDERKFTAWPEHIRKVFEPARTLKPGSLTIKLALKKAA